MPSVELGLQVDPAVAAVYGDAERENSALPSQTQWQAYVEQWIQTLPPHLLPQPAYEVSLRLTTDADIQALNACYRQQNTPTDVLAFAALEGNTIDYATLGGEPIPLGDIVISVETAARQAAEQPHPLSLELIWLAAHGLLHLLGWDHPTADALHQMLTQQAQLLDHIGLPSPSWSVQTLGYPD